MRKRLTKATIMVILVLTVLGVCSGCSEIWFKDKTSKSPDYHPIVSDDGSGSDNNSSEEHDSPNTVYATFVLELRMPTDEQETEESDAFAHSKLNGELICSWEIPFFGNTLYESVKKFFERRPDSITFRAEQHKFYMFRECVLENGEKYNLETAYVAVDGKYSYCANHQSLLGADGIAGTDDDVKIVVLVYEGWLN